MESLPHNFVMMGFAFRHPNQFVSVWRCQSSVSSCAEGFRWIGLSRRLGLKAAPTVPRGLPTYRDLVRVRVHRVRHR